MGHLHIELTLPETISQTPFGQLRLKPICFVPPVLSRLTGFLQHDLRQCSVVRLRFLQVGLVMLPPASTFPRAASIAPSMINFYSANIHSSSSSLFENDQPEFEL